MDNNKVLDMITMMYQDLKKSNNEIKEEIRETNKRIDKLENRFDGLENKFDKLENTVKDLSKKADETSYRLSRLEYVVYDGFNTLEEINRYNTLEFNELKTRVDTLEFKNKEIN